MNRFATIVAMIMGTTACLLAAPEQLPKPKPPQLAWQEAELGVMFSYDERVFRKQGFRDHVRDSKLNPQIFNPTKLDMNQWAETVKAMNGTFAFFTTGHETGFRFWQSDANPYCLKKIRWRNGKGDLVREFVDACRAAGIKPGLFLESKWGANHRIKNGRVPKRSRLSQADYNRLLEKETEELATRYGEIFEFWWDGGVQTPKQGGPNLVPIVEKHQPQAIFYHSDQRRDVHWAGTESGTAAYPCWSTVNGKWCPAMADVPLRCRGKHIWFWQPGTEYAIASLKELQEMYYKSIGRNATLVVGLTPDPTGLVPAPDAVRCRQFGDWIRKTFGGPPLAETSGKGKTLTLELPADAKGPVRHLILQEEIKNGERVRTYVVEAEVAGEWQEIAAGSCIGHKRIERITPGEARKFRLRVTKSVGEPEIRSFSVR